MTYYRRRTPDWWEELAAGAAGAVTGLAAWYAARVLLARERLPDREERAGPGRPGREEQRSGPPVAGGEEPPAPR